MKKYILVFLVILTSFGCNEKVENYIQYIEGYWEIESVKKHNKPIKSYNINTTVDYFKVNDDLSGFRKKVSPNLEGKFIVNSHESTFNIKIKSNQLQIHYIVNNVNFVETIERASETEMVITNSEGFEYTYKPFESINLE